MFRMNKKKTQQQHKSNCLRNKKQTSKRLLSSLPITDAQHKKTLKQIKRFAMNKKTERRTKKI